MRRFRSARSLHASARVCAIALGLASAGAHPEAGGAAPASPAPLLLAQVSGIPTSPSFRMNLSPGVPGDAPSPIGSHDVPAKASSVSRPAASAAAVAVHSAAPAARFASASPSAAASGAAAIDPFEHLRERLAQTLGATPSGPDGKYVLRVSNHGESGDNVVSTARADRVAALAPRKSIARAVDASASASAIATAHAIGWDYAGANGPEAWSRLQPGFETCGTGTRQSPIDIRDGIAVELEPIQFDYHAGAFTVIDTGHTVEVDVPPGSGLTVQGRRYELVQFHFHRPSEERIDGRRFDMTVHLVHRDAQGRLAVVAVLLERGTAQPVIQAVWNNLPLERNEPVQATGTLDPAGLLPDDRRYYTYMGSLTTPPCTEGVLWMVMQRPGQLSSQQDAIFAHLYPMNARPVQAASGRLIKASE